MKKAPAFDEPAGMAAFPRPLGARATETVADWVAAMCARLGASFGFGVIGGACAPLADALGRSTLTITQTRHESGAAFAACEASLATGAPAVVFTTTGPGLLNALNGLVASKWDGARVLVLSASTGASHRRRLPVQETSAATMPMDALTGAPWFDFGAVVEDPVELPRIEHALAAGFSRPGGFVAHLSLATPLQARAAGRLPAPPRVRVRDAAAPSRAVVAEVAALLAAAPAAVWVGHGAHHAAAEVRALVDKGFCALLTPRAKGIVSERHPLCLGVTGAGGHAGVDDELRALGVQRTLVLGTRLGEASTFYRASLAPPAGFIHVDVDRSVFGAAYPSVETYGVEGELRAFLKELLPLLPERAPGYARAPQARYPAGEASAGDAMTNDGATAGVHPVAVMRAMQHVVVDGSDASVLAESGNAFGWANHYLRFDAPHRYRSSAAWGSMGHMVAGAVGAALADGKRKKCFVISGDGAMLMNNEVNTAVQCEAPVVWVVLNDAGYGIVRDGMKALGLTPFGCDFPPTDFVAFARAQGADGVTVTKDAELVPALEAASRARGPFVVDVTTMRGHMSPAFLQRNDSLQMHRSRSP